MSEAAFRNLVVVLLAAILCVLNEEVGAGVILGCAALWFLWVWIAQEPPASDEEDACRRRSDSA